MKHCNGGLIVFLPVRWLAARRPRRRPPLPKTVRREADRAMHATAATVVPASTAVLRTARQHEAQRS